MSMTISQIAAFLDSLNASASAFRQPESYVDDERRWSFTVTLSRSDTEIKIRGEGPTLDEAMAQAYAKLEPLVNAPAVANALAIPRLAAPTIDGELLGDAQ